MDFPSSSSSPHYNNRRWQGLIYGNPQQQQQEATAAKPELMRQDASQEEEEEEESRAGPAHSIALIEKEHMFDKVVTPSDVGKLNRLVIPKQHAEKYFPLDSSTNDKGLLLNFEDRTGKPWRFRYSYWNSSQSYVMTKGWSRFVKEKKLDAGDIVSFQRGVGEHARDRLFIDWRRRPDIAPTPPPLLPGNPHAFRTISWPAAANSLLLRRPHPHPHPHPAIRDHTATHFMNVMSIVPPPPHPNWINSSTGIISYAPTNISGTPAHFAYGDVVNTYAYPPLPGSVVYVGSASSAIPASPHLQTQVQPHHLRQHLQSEEGGAGSAEPMVFESVPVVPSNRAPPKRLRLFGVNMDCPVPQVDPHDSAPVPVQDKQYEQATSAASSNSDDLPLQLRLYSSASNLDPATSRLP